MEIKNLKELRSKGRLDYGDILYFGDQSFIVCINHLYIRGLKLHTDAINKLFQSVNKRDFCKEAYGYNTTEGIFPHYKNDDYAAAYRLAEKIYIEIFGEGEGYPLESYSGKKSISYYSDKPKFKQGDRVRIRNWESMALEFGIGELPLGGEFINTGDAYFTNRMRHLCGKEAIVTTVYNSGRVDLTPIGGYDNLRGYALDISMIEHVYPKSVSLISDIENKTNSSLSNRIGRYPMDVSYDLTECCTSEKKNYKRFKIQNFLNERDRN